MAIYDTLVKKGDNNIKSNTKKGLKTLELFDSSIRPLSDEFTISNKNKAFTQLNNFGFGYITLFDVYALSKYADILQIIFNARNREIFRNGIDIDPLYDEMSENHLELYEKFSKSANDNGQSLIEVLQEFNKDLDVFDDAYLLCSKDYYFNDSNELVGSQLVEILRIDPLSVEMVLDGSNRLGRFPDGRTAYVSLTDRNTLTDKPIDKKTGRENIIAHYRVTTNESYVYYNNTEILHKSAFEPSITYGYSPLFGLYNKVLILLGQDYYIKQYYTQDKPLKGLLAFNTNNWEGLKKVLDQIDVEKKQYPHKIFPIPFNNMDNRKPVEFIDMSRSLEEMQYKDTRNEIRNQIGAVYGVSPIFQNDMSTSGGLNNEGLQITVTNRAIEDRQSLFNNYVLPFIFRTNLGITTFNVFLNPSEEQDDIHEEELESKRIANAKAKLELGLKGVMDEEGNFIFTEGELELQKQENSLPFFANESVKEVDAVTPVNITKVTKEKIPKREQIKFRTNLEKELDKIIKKLNFKSKPTENELNQVIEELTSNLEKQLKVKSANRVKSIYSKSKEGVEKELKTRLKLTDIDKNAIEILKRDPDLTSAIKDLSGGLKLKAYDIIQEAYKDPEKFTIDKITDNLKQELDLGHNRLRTIARTETTKISVAARKNSYDQTGKEYKYFHTGPSDNRTSKASTELKELTKSGVSWGEYVNLMKQVVSKYNPKWEINESYPITHPNTRHIFIARQVE